MSWGGRYSPFIVAASTAVIWRLSSEWEIGTTFSPDWCIVHWPVGTNWRAVWSQLMIRSSGISFMITSAVTSAKNTFLISLKSGVGTFLAFEHLRLTYPILLSKDFAHVLVISMWPPWDVSLDASLVDTMPSAAAITTAVLTTPSIALKDVMYSCTAWSSSTPNSKGRPCFF